MLTLIPLEEKIAHILELVPEGVGPVWDAVWNLTVDLRAVAKEKGETTAVLLAATLENGVRSYLEYERVIRTMVPGKTIRR